jgi:hypothetical protein
MVLTETEDGDLNIYVVVNIKLILWYKFVVKKKGTRSPLCVKN